MLFAEPRNYFGSDDPSGPCHERSEGSIVSSKQGMAFWRSLVLLMGLTLSLGVRADNEAIRLSNSGSSEWTLEVRGAPLGEIFKTLTEKMGVPVVSAPPPDTPLNLRCSGADIRAILSCLLGLSLIHI